MEYEMIESETTEAEVQEIPELEESAAEEAGSLGALYQEAQVLRARMDESEITTYRTLNEEYEARTEGIPAERESLDAEESEILAGQNPEREAAQRHVYDEEVIKAQAAGNAKAEAIWREKIDTLDEKARTDAEDLRRIQARRQEIDAECKRIAQRIWHSHNDEVRAEIRQQIVICLERIEAIQNQAQRFCSESGFPLSSSMVRTLSHVSLGGKDRILRRRIDKVFR